jgi:chromate transporter
MNEDSGALISLTLYFALASLMAVGGGVIMLAPEIHHQVVDVRHLMTNEQFAAAYTLAQAAPGPNMLFVTLVGWQVAGWVGALAATFAVIGPPSILTLVVMRMLRPDGDSRLVRAFKAGMAPLSVGLLFAAAWVLATASKVDWHGSLLVLVTIVLVLRTKLNPVLLIAAGAVAGLVGFV